MLDNNSRILLTAGKQSVGMISVALTKELAVVLYEKEQYCSKCAAF
jgi:hypothetical protein